MRDVSHRDGSNCHPREKVKLILSRVEVRCPWSFRHWFPECTRLLWDDLSWLRPLSLKLTPGSHLRGNEWHLDASRWMISSHVKPLYGWESAGHQENKKKQIVVVSTLTLYVGFYHCNLNQWNLDKMAEAKLQRWSPWSFCEIPYRVGCPSSSVVCRHRRQADSSQVAIISLSPHSRAQRDGSHLHFLHMPTGSHRNTHRWCCRQPGHGSQSSPNMDSKVRKASAFRLWNVALTWLDWLDSRTGLFPRTWSGTGDSAVVVLHG